MRCKGWELAAYPQSRLRRSEISSIPASGVGIRAPSEPWRGLSFRLPGSLAAQGLPQSLVAQLTRLSGVLQGVGNSAAILERVLSPELFTFIPKVLAASNDAFAHATGMAFEVTLIGGLVAFAITILLRDRELEQTPRP